MFYLQAISSFPPQTHDSLNEIKDVAYQTSFSSIIMFIKVFEKFFEQENGRFYYDIYVYSIIEFSIFWKLTFYKIPNLVTNKNVSNPILRTTTFLIKL